MLRDVDLELWPFDLGVVTWCHLDVQHLCQVM